MTNEKIEKINKIIKLLQKINKNYILRKYKYIILKSIKIKIR